MKTIVHLTSAIPSNSGALTYDLHNKFLRAGYLSFVVALRSETPLQGVVTLHRSKFCHDVYHLMRNIFRRLRGGKRIRLERNSDYHFNIYSEEKYYSARRIQKAFPRKVDILIIHFYESFLNSETISKLGRITGARILWLFMDMAPMTGGCHYSWGCSKYKSSCSACPAIISTHLQDRAWEQHVTRKNNLEGMKIEVVTGSAHQYRQARESSLWKDKRIHKILIGVDSHKYFSRVDNSDREQYGLPNDGSVIFFAAAFLHDKRKGFDIFNKVVKLLAADEKRANAKGLTVLIAGIGEIDWEPLTTVSFKNVGHVSAADFPKLLRQVDLLVCPSIEDSGPMVVSQALMSGVPVVMFRTGVSDDLIVDGVNGYAVPLGNVEKMVEACEAALSEHSTLAQAARAKSIKTIDSEIIMHQWFDLIG